eukprot:scaffold61142_cov57-Cyclotella_meneghiniana.AAC.5
MSSNHRFRGGRGPTRGRGRFSNRGGGRLFASSHSYIRTQQRERESSRNNKKWIRSSDDTSSAIADAEPDEQSAGKSTDGGIKLGGVEAKKGDDLPDNESKEQYHNPIDGLEPNKASEHEKTDVTTIVTKTNDFERRGRHKLVLKKDNDDDATNTENVTSFEESSVKQDKTSSKGIGVTLANSTNNDYQDDTEKVVVTSASLEKLGKNKLVLKKDNSRKVEPTATTTTATDNIQTHSKASFTWSRQPAVSQPIIESNSLNDEATAHRYRADTRKRMRQNNTQHYNNSAKGSRRICLNSNNNTQANESSSTDVPDDGTKLLESSNKDTKSTDNNNSTTTNKNLTDFAYRDTGRGKRGHKIIGPRTANMGLVRVKPEDPSTTAICPTFRRGLPCNNPKCTLRHDVSSEASRPICVFFQRNGMCSKGDECIFRHVKVRYDAEVCPMFERVGYCEDPDCVLMHVVVSKKSKRDT